MMAQAQLQQKKSNTELMDAFIVQLLQRCVKNKMIHQYDNEVYMAEEDSRKFDELLHKQKLIEAKVNRYKREKLKALKIISEFRMQRNLKMHLPHILQSNIISMISSPALTKLLDASFSSDNNVHQLIEKVNAFCNDINTHLSISDTDEKIFNSEEEELAACESRKKTRTFKRKRVSRCHKKKHSTDDDCAELSSRSEIKNQLESDLYLSDSEDEE